jgi:hypothetical protein
LSGRAQLLVWACTPTARDRTVPVKTEKNAPRKVLHRAWMRRDGASMHFATASAAWNRTQNAHNA